MEFKNLIKEASGLISSAEIEHRMLSKINELKNKLEGYEVSMEDDKTLKVVPGSEVKGVDFSDIKKKAEEVFGDIKLSFVNNKEGGKTFKIRIR